MAAIGPGPGRLRKARRFCGPAAALLAAACADGPASPGERVVLDGRVHAPAGHGTTGLWAVWQAQGSARRDSAAIGGDGRFEVVISERGRGELTIASAGYEGSLHPFLYPFDADAVADLEVVMVPRLWTIRRGIHQGETVGTPLDLVVDDNANQLLYSYFFAQPHPRNDPTTYLLDLMVWPETNLPAKVAIDHRHATRPLTAQDSTDIWAVLERMEEVFGLDLFEPAAADPAWWPEAPTFENPAHVPGVIRLLPWTGWSAQPAGSDEPAVWEHELRDWAGEGRFTAARVQDRLLDGGTLRVGSLDSLRLADGFIPWETVFMHEMLHVLGVGHTCRFPSPQGPCGRTPEPSRWDVAYMELLREVVALDRNHGGLPGILPALIGERRLLLGVPALPALESW